MRQDIQQLLSRTFEAYKEGRYMAIFGQSYEKYVHSNSIEELIAEVQEQDQYRATLEAAFADNPPLKSEIYLYILDGSSVITNERMLLIADKKPSHPPIPLGEIKAYHSSGFWMKREQIELADGTAIDRKTDSAVDEESFMKLVDAARHPEQADALSTRPEPSDTSPEQEASPTPTIVGEEIANRSFAGLDDLHGRCSSCRTELSTADVSAVQWVAVRAVERKEKSVVCLGFPLGWEFFADAIKVAPVKEFETAICEDCSTSLRGKTGEEVDARNAEQATQKKQTLKIVGPIALTAAAIAAAGFFAASQTEMGAWVDWIAWISAIAAGVLALMLLDAVDTPGAESVDEVFDDRAYQIENDSINAAIESSGTVEILRDDQPTDMDAATFIVLKDVFKRGSKTGWTLFRCWGMMDEPGGTRRQEMTTEEVRERDVLHEDISSWIATDTG